MPRWWHHAFAFAVADHSAGPPAWRFLRFVMISKLLALREATVASTSPSTMTSTGSALGATSAHVMKCRFGDREGKYHL
ncbi:hypothetical protein CK230_21155 [Mesorhizobium sp. WSM3859]|nr:hypothetical protein CK230_21155 [Mesorhizobium sp. WSM3859]